MYKQISHTEAVKLMDEGKAIIADVRDKESYDEEHIAEAVHLSMTVLHDFCLETDKSIPIILYCYHGISSQPVAQHLVDQGFANVYSLLGGFEVWKEHHPTSAK